MIDKERSSTLARMHDQTVQFRKDEDQRAVFLECYAMMTENMLTALDKQRFHDVCWVTNLLDHFAEYYFESLENFESDEGV